MGTSGEKQTSDQKSDIWLTKKKKMETRDIHVGEMEEITKFYHPPKEQATGDLLTMTR